MPSQQTSSTDRTPLSPTRGCVGITDDLGKLPVHGHIKVTGLRVGVSYGVGLALGLSPKELGMNKHVVPTNEVQEKISALAAA